MAPSDDRAVGGDCSEGLLIRKLPATPSSKSRSRPRAFIRQNLRRVGGPVGVLGEGRACCESSDQGRSQQASLARGSEEKEDGRGFHGRHKVFSKGGEQRSAQEVGIWQKFFLCSNQAGTSPHKKRMNFFANYLSWHDSFCLCGKTRNPHWLLLAARSGLRIFCLLNGVSLESVF